MRDDTGTLRSGTRLRRRLRGTLGIASLWSGAFSLLGMAAGALLIASASLGFLPYPPDSQPILLSALAGVVRWAAIGALSGVLFSLTVMAKERRQTLHTLSPARIARWGFLAGALGTAAVATAIAALFLPPSLLASHWQSLVTGFAAVPFVGGALGRYTARASLRAAQSDERKVGPLPSLEALPGA